MLYVHDLETEEVKEPDYHSVWGNYAN
jgi:hypothetical protein